MNFPAESIAELVSRGAYEDAIAKLKTIPKEKQTIEDVFSGAFALTFKMDWPTAGRMEELRWGVSLLEHLIQQIGEAPECALVLGFAHYQLGEYEKAAEYLKEAPKTGFDITPSRRELISSCRQAIKRPADTESFPARVQRAWETFAQEEEELRRLLRESAGRPRREKKVMDRINQLVDMALPRAGWSVARGDRPVLQLDPDISLKSTALQQKYFADHAPKAVTDHWEVRVGFAPPTDQQLQRMQRPGGYFSGMQVQIAPLADDLTGDLYELVAYHPHLDPRTVTRDTIGDAMDWILTCLGTLPYLNAFLSVDFRGMPPKGPTMKLEQLLPALEARGWGDRNDVPTLLHRRHTYRRDPAPLDQNDEHRWRADIVRATSIDPNLELFYADGTSDAYTERFFAGTGAVPGFAVFPLEGRTGLMETLLQELDAAMDPETAAVLGNAEGLQFGYLDLLAWDLQPALDTVKELLQKHNIPWAHWHTFYTLDRTVQIF